jgi:WD40 repeat protein/tRNA A-37 threonylcarbamoyl transferase component Bud32
MSKQRKCRECGCSLPEWEIENSCSACLLRLGLRSMRGENAIPFPQFEFSDSESSNTFETPRRLGDYEILEQIARGGMGIVYKARQIKLNRVVALKVLIGGPFSTTEFYERFQSEAVTVASLQHPNIVSIFEIGHEKAQPFIAMEYVSGKNLADLIREQPLAPRRAAACVKTISLAIHYAHEKGVLHRDLKPSNILIDTAGEPRVTDFGLAKRLSGDSDITLTGQLLGTPSYIAPEQTSGKSKSPGPPSDIYSLGAILYHALTGRAPFRAETIEETLLQVLHSEPIKPRLLNPSVPPDLETICLKCLEKEPAKRYATAEDLAQDLNRFLNHQPIKARPATVVERAGRWAHRNPALAATLSGLVIVFFLGFTATAWQWKRAEQAAGTTAKALTRMEIQKAEDLFSGNDSETALAYLAKILREDPNNHVAAERAVSALTYRSFPIPITSPLKHQARIYSAHFSPDGNYVVTASADHTAQVWETRTGLPIKAPLQHQGRVFSAEFDRSGKRVLTASEDGSACIWDSFTGERLIQLKHDGTVKSAQFSPDGSCVVTASTDQTVRLWDAITGDPIGSPLSLSKNPNFARFSPDAELIVTGATEIGQVWNARTGRPVGPPLVHEFSIGWAEFSPDSSKLVTTSSDGTAQIWNARTGELLIKLPGHSPHIFTARFSPDGQRLATSTSEGVARVWDVATGNPLTEPMQHDAAVLSVSFSSEAERVITAAGDFARIWDSRTGQPLTSRLRHDRQVRCAEFSPNGRLVLTASDDGTAMIWPVTAGHALPSILPHAQGVISASWSPQGNKMLTVSKDHIRVWRAGSQDLITTSAPHSRSLRSASFFPDGRRIVSTSRDGTALILDATTGKPLTTPLQHDRVVWMADVRADGKFLATASWDGTVKIWDAATGEIQRKPIQFGAPVFTARFNPKSNQIVVGGVNKAQILNLSKESATAIDLLHDDTVTHAEFSPDGTRVITACKDGSARIWNAQTGQPLTEPLRHSSALYFVCFSPDGRLVVTCSQDKTARTWDGFTGDPVSAPMRHEDAVFNASFSPDSSRLGTASYDHTAAVWDARSGQRLQELFYHDATVFKAEFSSDGRRILTCSDDGTARIYDAPTPPLPVPDWFIDFIETVAGQKLDKRGAPQPIAIARLMAFKEKFPRMDQTDFYGHFVRWFFADRSTRTSSLFGTRTLPESVEALIKHNSLTSLSAAMHLDPTNALATIRLAFKILDESNNLRPSGEAAWLAKRAARLDPANPEIATLKSNLDRRLENLQQISK